MDSKKPKNKMAGLPVEFSSKWKKNVLRTQFVHYVHGDPFKYFIAAAGRGGFVDFW
jgi:hypothetical protein